MNTSKLPSCSFDIVEKERGALTVHIKGKMDFQSASLLIKAFSTMIKSRSPKFLTVGLEQVTYFDDYGALVLDEVKRLMGNLNHNFKIDDPHHITDKILSFINFESLNQPADKISGKTDGFVVNLGQSALVHSADTRTMISFLGSVFLSFIRILTHPKSLRISDTLVSMEKIGVNALPIVSLISFLLGFVMAFMSSLQLQQFGANIYVASLVAIGMVSELGPIMTAIVVAGRSGSAFAAEIGSMKISEEIDALTSMGFEPVLFLTAPRMIASIIVVPILTFFSDIFAILGGLVIGVFMLNLTMTSYISQTLETLTFFEITWGAMKSFVFAVIISLVGCLRGFQTRGGADAVGNAATSAVVSSIFLIILFDSFFAILRSYW